MYNSQYNPYLNYNQPQYGQQYNIPQFIQNNVNKIQGKIIDNLDVVKATEIPMDGSLSVFPLADKSAIATKQLMTDGTSKITIYKPAEEKENIKIEYVTKDDIANIEDELNELKKEFKSFKKEK